MASRKFLVPANLLNLASDPASGTSGDIYFNTTSDKLKIYDGSVWVEVGAGGGGSTITVSETAPVSPTTGDAWYQNTTGSFYVYDGSFWVEVNGVIAAAESFKTISVSGQSDIVADTTTDTLTFVAGTNVSITTNATNDSITINSTGNYTSVDSITYPDYITFDTTPETIPTAPGSLYWDSGDGLPATVLNANVSIGLGQEQVALVKNATGSSIAKGKVVYISGAQGQRPTITLSDADTETTSSKTFGVTAEVIADGAEGFVTTFGVLRGLNTDGLTEGAPIWLSTTAGNFTTSIPAEPAHSVFIGYVVKAHASSGEIFVNIQNGYELNELHGVVIENDGVLTDNEVLAYDTASGLWKNQTSVEAGLIDTSSTAQTKSGDLTLTGKNSIYDTREYLYAVNDEGATVNALSAVVLNGVTIAGVPKFKLADADQIGQGGVVGLTIASVGSGATATVITRGMIEGINTSSYADGQILYISTGGVITGTRPTGSASRVHKIGKVVIADELAGKIYVLGTIEEDLPNLENLKIWLGNTNDQPTETTLSTTIVPEGTALYFTDERAQDAIGNNLGTGLSYNDSTGAISNSGVLDLTGTTNEIVVSGSTGSVTIGIPDSPVFVTPNIGVATATSINGTTIPSSKTLVVTTDIGSTVQAYDADLGAIAALTGTSGILTTNGSGTWSVDTNTYSTTAHNHSVNSLSNVVITGTPTDGQALVWDTTTSKWVNETVVQDLSGYQTTISVGSGLSLNSSTISVNPGAMLNQIVDGTSGNSYGLVGTSAYLDVKDTNGYNKEIELDIAAVEAKLVIDGFLNSETDTLETVTDRGATSSNAITISNATASSSPTTGALIVTGGVGIGEDLYVDNDVYVGGNINITGSITGDLTSINVTNLVVTDPLIYLAEANPNDSVDIGIFAALNHGGPSYSHTGLIRDASDSGKWKLASGLADPTSNVINFTGATFDTLKIGVLEVVDASTTRTNLGLTIGTNVQAYNSTLAAVAGGTYTGDDSITTVGTISSGTWNGTTLGYAYGGTGLTTLGTAGQVLTVNAGATAIEWADGGGSGAGTVVSTTPPASPVEGMGWFDNGNGKLYIYDGTFWVEASNNLNDEAVMDIVSTMIGNGAHTNLTITYNDATNALSFDVLSEPITDFITLNPDVTGTPSTNAGIIVNRGDLTDVAIRFNETEDAWEYTNDGVEYQAIGSGGGAVSTNTALSNSFWLGA